MSVRELSSVQNGMWAGMYSQEDYIDKKSQKAVTGLNTVKKQLLRDFGFIEPIDPEFHKTWQNWRDMQKHCGADLNVNVGGMTIREIWITETLKPAIKEAMVRARYVRGI